jgi:hypothetical protein
MSCQRSALSCQHGSIPRDGEISGSGDVLTYPGEDGRGSGIVGAIICDRPPHPIRVGYPNRLGINFRGRKPGAPTRSNHIQMIGEVWEGKTGSDTICDRPSHPISGGKPLRLPSSPNHLRSPSSPNKGWISKPLGNQFQRAQALHPYPIESYSDDWGGLGGENRI